MLEMEHHRGPEVYLLVGGLGVGGGDLFVWEGKRSVRLLCVEAYVVQEVGIRAETHNVCRVAKQGAKSNEGKTEGSLTLVTC